MYADIRIMEASRCLKAAAASPHYGAALVSGGLLGELLEPVPDPPILTGVRSLVAQSVLHECGGNVPAACG